MVEISTSILGVKKEEESSIIFKLEKAKTDYFHIDVMDGKFVAKDNYQKMFEKARTVVRLSNAPLDVHLMVANENLQEAIFDALDLQPNLVTFHVEACTKEEAKRYIKLITHDARVGIAIKPDTNLSEIYELLPFVHVILIMTVEPGMGGQTYLNSVTSKIKELKEYIKKHKLDTQIEVDGGINLVTAPLVKEAGADILVAGTSILIAKDFGKIIKELR